MNKYNKDTVIALLGIRGISVSILKAIEDNNIKYILPVIVYKGFENITIENYEAQYKILLNIVNDKYKDVKIYSPLYISNINIWKNLSTQNMKQIGELFNVFYSPCFGCHLYNTVMSIVIANKLKISSIIIDKKPSVDRTTFKMDKTNQNINKTINKLYKDNNIKIIDPLRLCTKFEDVSHLITDKNIFTIEEPDCILSMGKLKDKDIALEYQYLFDKVLYELGKYVINNQLDSENNKKIASLLVDIHENRI